MIEVNFQAGDSVRVHAKIKEGGRERIQIFEGMVLGVRGRGDNKTFTVRRIGAGGVGIERIWPILSPSVEKVEVKKKGDFRRAKVFFIRHLSAKDLTAAATKKS